MGEDVGVGTEDEVVDVGGGFFISYIGLKGANSDRGTSRCWRGGSCWRIGNCC